nr:hypothetical protein CFP56_60548 [Quercus suber]
MTRSKNRLRDLREEGRAKGKDTAHEGGNADEDIDNFTLDPEDMEASPSHPQTKSSVHQVCDLFFLDTRVWDPGRLESCLILWEADLVKRIQVCEDGAEDTLIWPLISDRDYSVRSAYRMLISVESILLPSSSVSGSNGLVWKKIWKIRVPNKIRHFIWRAAKDSLPTK